MALEDPRKQIPSREQFTVLERRSRWATSGCGAVLGFAVGVLGALGSPEDSWGRVVALGLLLAVVFAVLCGIFGDRLLDRLVRILSWWS